MHDIGSENERIVKRLLIPCSYGVLIAYLRLSPFVVTLGMLSIARSLALVVSNNKMVYEFGPDEELFIETGGGMIMGVANPVIVLVVLTVVFALVFKFTTWGRHVYAIGGNEQAARLNGVPVDLMKVSVYMLCALMAGVLAIGLYRVMSTPVNDRRRTAERLLLLWALWTVIEYAVLLPSRGHGGMPVLAGPSWRSRRLLPKMQLSVSNWVGTSVSCSLS